MPIVLLSDHGNHGQKEQCIISIPCLKFFRLQFRLIVVTGGVLTVHPFLIGRNSSGVSSLLLWNVEPVLNGALRL